MSDNRDVQAEQEVSGVDETVQDAEVILEEQSSPEAESDATQRIYELETALSEAQATIKEQQDSVLRARADVENARRRAEMEVEKARKFALERFAGELLPVVDNLERAIELTDGENEAVKPLLEGVEMTHKSFLSTIEKFGLSLIDPQGETFNPDLHQAMSMQESADHAPNTVMAVMQKGYQINGRLLRPAMVMVSRAPSGGVDTQA
ncbi:nucleotide exchange factor GrpE [Alteromonas stellipolaris]|jgi:molecular chaperone GrpE|uniref:Protein GrpE n=1 Tax=Alteromonas stellipolaris TaxID=233316 RepID=A0AAW7Z5H7_9ALTE|nr:nucleotide exchange factor GrpE [Alteromonas stellipolaris]ANB26724.1 nucleotide exchange factor GrpE [Alteromonas stellipolaris]MDO6536675.1 nucleotide exchange factor GrpE [Alteromonas stellipolaris]MDO6579262.1 nucleotide exchange factor GrpE [Alteromonas stellipolaris]MDO6628056.1 nucleotide exchange factor GrpE [Alteromonas stellipolaris]MDP2537714.1 nucleotide exchange factor GrpE [Alteromonas stellipolaris]